MRKILEYSKIPNDGRTEWLSSAKDSITFLKESYFGDRIILFASLPCFIVHGVLVDQQKLSPVDHADLAKAYFHAGNEWSLEHVSGGGQPDRMYLAAPLSSTGSKMLTDAEQLVFHRVFEGVPSKGAYIEISQKLVQALGLHFLEERNAYCRIDENGDIQAVIEIEKFPKTKDDYGGVLVTILAEDLTEFMAITGTALAVKFDFTRVDHKSFPGWGGAEREEFEAPDLSFHGGKIEGRCSFVNGWLIVRPKLTVEDVIARRNAKSDRSLRQYAEFKIFDFRYNQQRICSCSPKATTNYFDATEGLPFDLSPAFFRADVLSKYKADNSKYQLDTRSIRCRSTWGLRSYDINEAGQVHTYLVDLSHLPYEEQLYWQSFNEWPKAPISKRSFDSDFRGEWTDQVDPLDNLKRRVAALDKDKPDWWSPRGEDLLRTVHYPSTENSTEWADEIMRLDQALVEGFRTKQLKAIAAKIGAVLEPNWASLKIIEACLVAGGYPSDDAKEAVEPLQTLHGLRNTLKAHSAGKIRLDLEREAIREFKTYRGQYENLAARCDGSLQKIIEFLTRNDTQQAPA